MTEWQQEDIRGYMVNNKIVCRKCITEEEGGKVLEPDLIIGERSKFENENGEDFIFCDRCRERI